MFLPDKVVKKRLLLSSIPDSKSDGSLIFCFQANLKRTGKGCQTHPKIASDKAKLYRRFYHKQQNVKVRANQERNRVSEAYH